jgi:hypothetical protein
MWVVIKKERKEKLPSFYYTFTQGDVTTTFDEPLSMRRRKQNY